MQRREEQTGDRNDEAAKAGEELMPHQVDFGFEPRSEELQILLGGDVVVDRVEDLGGDAFGLLAVDIGVGQGIGQGKPVGQGRLRLALRIRARRKADAEPAVSGSSPYPSRPAF
jgi:hypothetical protein